MARSIVGIAASVGAVSVLLGLPVASGAQTGVDAADQVVEHVRGTVDGVVPGVLPAKPKPSAGVQRQAQPAQPRAAQPRGSTPGSPGGYQPPLHGSGPHGQGTVGVVDLSPGGTRPLSPNPSGSQPQPQDNEDVVIGRARGEQDAQGYHGHITVVALLGNELVGVDSRPGQSVTGPLEAVQQGVLNNLCSTSQVCLTVLQADSTTTANSSSNKFAVTRAEVGGPTGINAGAAESQGNLSQDANCQTATGSSSVANVRAGGAPLADAANSSSQSQSCRDRTG